MRRQVDRTRWLVLLLVSGVVVGAHEPAAAQAAAASQPQAKSETAQRQTVEPQGRTGSAGPTAGAPQSPAPDTPGAAEAASAPAGSSPAEDAPAQDGEARLLSTPGAKALGISILGNQEAPTSLVIVPWKSSELGSSSGISPLLDDSRQPVDKDVFMRSLRYHEISSGTTSQDSAKAGGRDNAAAGNDAAQTATAAPRRK